VTRALALQFIAKEIVKDAVAYANACTLKGRACAAAGFVSEAMDLLADVYAGRGLPDVVPLDRPPKGVEGPAPKKEVYFDQSLDAAHESNQAAVTKLIESKLPDELASQVETKHARTHAHTRHIILRENLAKCPFF
jgi:hypothetical protein